MKVLCIAVHPDDETLGCGGTLLKYKKQGVSTHWLILTQVTEGSGFTSEFIEKRGRQIQEVSKRFGFESVHQLPWHTTQLHNVDFSKLLSSISEVIQKIKPEVVYFSNRSDIHTDHQVAAKAIFSATKAFRYPFIKKLYMYECISETEAQVPLAEFVFTPNTFCDVTDTFEEKLNIMKIYDTELLPEPFPRSIETISAQARYRGAVLGVRFAEAFQLLREKF